LTNENSNKRLSYTETLTEVRVELATLRARVDNELKHISKSINRLWWAVGIAVPAVVGIATALSAWLANR